MLISKITIKNLRLFPSDTEFVIDDINIPDGSSGSGLNVFVGENGSGKTSILDALTLPLLEYKIENFSVDNFNDLDKKVEINLYSKDEFSVDGTMPKGSFKAKGFSFEAGLRARDTKTYFSSIVVSDQKFISSDPSKPKEGSPDLRSAVNNPFKGKRFNENDILFLDKNRLSQARSGNFNTTRFDRLMEDFSYQYIRGGRVTNLNDDLDEKIKKDRVSNEFLVEAIQNFQQMSGHQIKLDFLNNHKPFKDAFFSVRKESHQQIAINSLGSGYEMIFSILYSVSLAKQGGKQLIIIIDEPELHLHPALQEKFVDFLLDSSKKIQIFISSHSPLFVKQLSYNEKVKIKILRSGPRIEDLENRVLPYISANETNFIAFDLATEEYHNELYEELKIRYDATSKKELNLKDFDKTFFQDLKSEPANYPYFKNQNQISIHTHLRNQIHHRGTSGKADIVQIGDSIKKMRDWLHDI